MFEKATGKHFYKLTEKTLLYTETQTQTQTQTQRHRHGHGHGHRNKDIDTLKENYTTQDDIDPSEELLTNKPCASPGKLPFGLLVRGISVRPPE